MTISATNQGLRPGVCLSTSRPSTPFDGQVIYETDTNRVLVWDNSAWVMIADTDSPPGLQLIKTQTIGSAVSSVTVSDVFSSEFDNYRVIVIGGTGSTAQGIHFSLGSSTTGYYGSALTVLHGSDSIGYIRSNNASAWLDVGISTTAKNFVDVTVYEPFISTPTGMTHLGRADYRTTGGSGTGGGGFHNVSASYTSFTLSVGGTMTGGTIRVYGYRNS